MLYLKLYLFLCNHLFILLFNNNNNNNNKNSEFLLFNCNLKIDLKLSMYLCSP